MKKTLLTMAAALALVGCSNDDLMTGLENNGAQTKGAVGVNTFVPTITRGAALNSVDDLEASGNGFDLISYYNDGTGTDEAPNYQLFMGTAEDGIQFEHDGGWDYADRGEIKFWQELPDGATDMKFFAVSPSKDSEKWPTDASYNIEAKTQTITYTVPTEVSEQVDIMYAQKDLAEGEYTNTSDAYTNGVPLNFHHALSQIVFKAKIADKEDTKDADGNEVQDGTADYVTAHVNSITVKNVYGAGTFDMAAASSILGESEYLNGELEGTGYDNTLWTVAEDDTKASYTIEAGENTAWSEITSIEAAELTDGTVGIETALMLLPQDLEGLDISNLTGASSANEDQFATLTDKTGSYLVVNCRVEYKRDNGEVVAIVGSKDATIDDPTQYYANLYIPIGTQWNPGYKYVYTLIFSADSGDPVKATVESVDEWNEYHENVPETGENNTEEELTQAEMNARLVAAQFAPYNVKTLDYSDATAPKITESYTTLVANGDGYVDYQTWEDAYDETAQYPHSGQDQYLYTAKDGAFPSLYTYDALQNVINSVWTDNDGNTYRIPTKDEWLSLAPYVDYDDFQLDENDEATITETMNLGGEEISGNSTFKQTETIAYAIRFAGTEQAAAYRYERCQIDESGYYYASIKVKALKADDTTTTINEVAEENFWAEDVVEIQLPEVRAVNHETPLLHDGGNYISSDTGEYSIVYGARFMFDFGTYDIADSGVTTDWGSTENMHFGVRMIQCDADGNLVLE